MTTQKVTVGEGWRHGEGGGSYIFKTLKREGDPAVLGEPNTALFFFNICQLNIPYINNRISSSIDLKDPPIKHYIP